MPAAPGPPSTGGGLDLKRLPPWAWVVAIAGGAVVGFVLLKPGKLGGSQDEQTDEGGASSPGDERTSGETAVVQPITDEMRQALGLSPGYFGQGSSGGDFGGGGESSTSPTSSPSGAETFSTHGLSIPNPLGSGTAVASGATAQPSSTTLVSAPRPTIPTGTIKMQTFNIPRI